MLIKPVTGKLDLKNDGKLELFFIGVGSALATKHNQLNLLLIKGDTHIMVDFGMTGPKALLETAGLSIHDISVHLPTHSHADHIGGYEAVAIANRYVGRKFMGKPKLTAIITPHYQEILWDRSLRGGLEWNEEEQTEKKRLGFTDFFDVVRPIWKTNQPRETFIIDHGGIKIEMFRTKHIPDTAMGWEDSFVSYGLYVDEKVFISMDTRFDKELIYHYSPISDVMFHDVQFFPGAVHAPLADLKTLNDEIKGKMHLMHYSDDYEKQDISDFAGWTKQGVRYIIED